MAVGKKKHLHNDQVSSRVIPTKIKELDVKACYWKIVEDLPEVLEYLPDPYGKRQQLPDNKFFWTILYSTCRDSVMEYIRLV